MCHQVCAFASVQKELEGTKRNQTVFVMIVNEMKEIRYEWTWKQCQMKVKDIVSNYQKKRGTNKMCAEKSDLCCALCWFFASIYLVMLANVACSEAKCQQLLQEAAFLFNSHLNIVPPKLLPNAYKWVVL